MGLPLVVDIAIGLIFIYLILSLLASEVQEVITTIFQWRAKHLQESIHTLLSGDIDESAESSLSPEQREVLRKGQNLTQSLYSHPLIKGLNYQNTGKIAKWLRGITRIIDRNPVSGPSVIPSGTFASSILETLKVDQIVRELNEEKVDGFRDRISEAVDQACGHTDDLDPSDPRFPASLRASLNEEKMNSLLGIVVDEFLSKKISLNESFNRLYRHLVEYINSAKQIPDPRLRKAFINEFSALKQEIYIEEGQQAIWLDNTPTTVVQVIRAYKDLKEAYSNHESEISQKLKSMEEKFGNVYAAIVAKREEIRTVEFQITKARSELRTIQNPDSKRVDVLKQMVKDLTNNSQELRLQLKDIEKLKLPHKVQGIIQKFAGSSPEEIKGFLDTVPTNLMQSMTAIAEKTQATIADKIEDVEEDLAKFRGGVETWFDNGMERANGVFKRNSKGFAFLVGMGIAIASNVDTFYMVDQLSNDSELRNSLAQKAETTKEQGTQPTSSKELGGVNGQGLPIGWEPDNTNKQLLYRMDVKPEDQKKINSLFDVDQDTGRLELRKPNAAGQIEWEEMDAETGQLVKRQMDVANVKQRMIWGWVKQCSGWLISGVAISMGSPFWFGLLNQLVDLKNVGSGKSSSSSSSTSSSSKSEGF